MANQVTCALCGGPVDDADTVPMPNGPMCLDPCYFWLERMLDDEPVEEDEEFEIVVFIDEEGDDSWMD